MAFKRKRVYAGRTPSYRKKSRFAKRRRSSRPMRSSRSVYASSSKGNASALGFKRGTSYRRYKNLLWDASTLHTHYRSFLGIHVPITTPANSTTMVTTVGGLTATAFWTTAGGAITDFTPASNADIYIRGGVSTITFNNDATNNVRITLWVFRTTIKGSIASSGTVPVGWDPSLEADSQTNFKVIFRKDFQLSTDQAFTFSRRIRQQKIDTSMWTSAYNRDYYMFSIQSLSASSAATVDVTTSHNMSYTIDNV